ncbi:MAG: hypothetical protein U1D30_24900, partial [Planctomycetota bacterium]
MPRSHHLGIVKGTIFALVPATLLVLVTELALRGVEFFEPSLHSPPLTGEVAGIMRPDPELFWSLTPGVRIPYAGATVTISRQGIRSPEIGPK